MGIQGSESTRARVCVRSCERWYVRQGKKACLSATRKLYWYMLVHTRSLLRLQRSISSTFYLQLLQAKIPKAQKEADNLTEFLRFWNLLA